MKIINVIWSFVSDPSKRTFVLTIALAIAAMMWFRSCEATRRAKADAEVQQQIADQNARALTDSLHTITLRNGETETTTSAFMAKLSDLEKLNRDLYAESKKELGNLKAIIKGGMSINNPLHVSNELEVYGGDSYGLKFEKSSKTDSLDFSVRGVSKFSMQNNVIVPGTTDILENRTSVKLILGFTEDKDNYRVFARSPSKLLKIDELTGSLIIPKRGGDIIPQPAEKKKRFGIGLQIGYGITVRGSEPFIGLGLNYNLFSF